MNGETNIKPDKIKRDQPTSWRTYQVRVALAREASAPYGEQLTSPDTVFDLFRDDAARWDRERFLTLLLDTSHRLIGIDEVSVGTINSAPVHPREVMKAVILANATSLIFVHNHLSLELHPSQADMAATRRLRRVANLLQVKCLDHIIVGPGGFFSFVENDMWADLPDESE